MKKRIFLSLVASLSIACGALFAVPTQSKTADSYAGFSTGKLDNVVINQNGELGLGPSLESLATLEESVIYAGVVDKRGNLFLGTGTDKGTVYKMDAQGKLDKVFTAEEALVKALAIDGSGNLYVGTSPEGALYRIAPGAEAVKIFDPEEKYIWSLLFDHVGNLFVGTGQPGKIYRLKSGFQVNDTPEVWYDSKEDSFSALGIKPDGTLLAGSSTTGFLYEIPFQGKVSVLFNSGGEEIAAIESAPSGEVYCAIHPASSHSNGNGEGQKPEGPPALAKPGMPSVIAIQPNGDVEPIWAQGSCGVYSFVPYDHKRLLIGTGDQGRLFLSTNPWNWSLLQQSKAGGQISVITQDPGAQNGTAFYIVASNPAEVYRLSKREALKGSYTSEAFDAGRVSRWGKLDFLLSGGEAQGLAWETRSGNTPEPGDTWSEWQQLSADAQIQSPIARYLQYRIRWSDSTAKVRSVRFFYNYQNAAPEIAKVQVLPVGVDVMAMPGPGMQPIEIERLLQAKPEDFLGEAKVLAQEQIVLIPDTGLHTVVWLAKDRNNDPLRYTLEIREARSNDWIRLATDWDLPLYTFNSQGFKEGYYIARVTATDAFVNHAEDGYSNTQESAPFLIDYTPPVIELVSQNVDGNTHSFGFKVHDAHSIIVKAVYILDGSDAQGVLPENGFFDAKENTFFVTIEGLSDEPHSLIFSVWDELHNQSNYTLSF